MAGKLHICATSRDSSRGTPKTARGITAIVCLSPSSPLETAQFLENTFHTVCFAKAPEGARLRLFSSVVGRRSNFCMSAKLEARWYWGTVHRSGNFHAAGRIQFVW